ncbi:MAG: prolipoprotein diacylglyceryl transferase [Bacteroidales bacterium]|nr:prolipoprotein diacylglyceryl transferase [Bacteroidales bacterium]
MILNYIIWNVNPEIFSIPESVPVLGGFSVRWYGLFFAIGFVLGYIILQKIFKREGIEQKLTDDLFTYMFIFTILGARLGQVLFYEPHYYFTHPIEILKIWHGGLASHGAAVGILLGLYLFARRYKRPYIWVLDRIAIVVPLAGFFIRMGNLMNSEIFGYPTHLPWGFIFVRAMEPNLRVGPHQPTQIYEGLAYLLIFFFIFNYYKKHRTHLKPGKLFGFFSLLIFLARFLIEFLKEPQEIWEQHMLLDMGQLLSIPLIILGIALIIWSSKQAPINYDKSLSGK